MNKIELTRGKVALVDDEDYLWLNQWKWHSLKSKWTDYAGRTVHYPKKYNMKMHRLILNAPLGIEVDHIDHNGLNNQRSNLRLATGQENKFNHTRHKHSRSQYKGVLLSQGRFFARITKDYVCHPLGGYSCEADAALAYDHKARELFGDFAQLNFPEVDTSTIDFVALQRKHLTSNYQGVYFCHRDQRWKADVRSHGRGSKGIICRTFNSEEEAKQAVAEALAKWNQLKRL